MGWTREAVLFNLQNSVMALAQPAHIQLRLVPSFACPAAFLLNSLLRFCRGAEVNLDQDFITQFEAEALNAVRDQIIQLCLTDNDVLPSNIYSFIWGYLSPFTWTVDKAEKEGGILSRQALQVSPHWDTLRQLAVQALFKLDWPQSVALFAHQPIEIDLKNSTIVSNDAVMLSVTHKVEFSITTRNLLAQYLYSDDFNFGDEPVHLLEIGIASKAKMLELLKTQHNVSETLLPPDALLLDLIYISFGNWWQLHTWLWDNSVPFEMWF